MKISPSEQLRKFSVDRPDQNAVHFQRWYSYKEFSILVDKTATFLIELGFKRDQGISLYFEPSLDALVLIYAIGKIGAYYIPFNINQPPTLIEELLDDCKVTSIFCSEHHQHLFKNSITYSVDIITSKGPSHEIVKGSLAYELFTSGTTGRAKGVLVTTENLSYILNAMDKTFPCEKNQTLIWTTAITFDVSIIQIFGWIINGSKIVIPSMANKKSLVELPKLIEQFEVSHLDLAPTVLSSLIHLWDEKELAIINKNLKYLLIAGEEFKLELGLYTKKILPNCHVLNLYGPTETTVFATCYEITGNEKSYIAIGKALPGTTIKIINPETKQEVPNGEVGEIFILGGGVTAGYYNNQELTQKKFLTIENELAYASGDYGKFNEALNVEFLGRRDRQVQLHGIRFELGEIESRLDVMFDKPGKVRIISRESSLYVFYLAVNDRAVELKNYLEQFIPTYALPGIYVRLEKFPTTSSGKLDEAELLQLIPHSVQSKNKVEKSEGNHINIEVIQQKVLLAFDLELKDLSRTFSESGVDSLAIMIGISRLEKEFNEFLPETLILGSNTPDTVAIYLSQKSPVQNHGDTGKISDNDFIKNVLNLSNLWKQAGSFFFEKSLDKEQETHPLQKLYFFDGFESTLSLRLSFLSGETSLDIQKALQEIIKETQLLRSCLKLNEDGTLSLIDVTSINLSTIPQMSFTVDSKNIEKSIDQITETLAGTIKKIITNQFLHIPIILEFNNSIELVWVFSHAICDQSSIFFLKKKIIETVQGDSSNKSVDYSDFISFQAEKSNKCDYVNNPLTKELLTMSRNNDYSLDTEGKIVIQDLSNEYPKNQIKKIGSICYQVGKIISADLDIESFAISTIINIRDFNSFNASSIFGDCHSTVVFPYYAKENFNDFIRRFTSIYESYVSGASPYFCAFQHFPEMSEEEKILENAYDTIPIMGINYLGFLDDNDASEIEKSLLEARVTLNSFPGKRIYVTVFESVEKQLRAHFLTYPKKNLKDKKIG